jgi:hypothetical protein
MADDIGKKELGATGYGPGYGPSYPGYGPDYPGHDPGYPDYGSGDGVMYEYQRLQRWVGTSVTAVFADGSIIRGSLHSVGRDFAEIHRMRDSAREAVFVPLQNTVITGPIK